MLVQVAIMTLVLMAMATFVVDNGILWVARHQAQNAADGGALAGAVARAFDDSASPPVAGGPADTAARTVAGMTEIWNAAGTFLVGFDCPPGITGGGCVQVDVFRNGANGSATLPLVFGNLFPSLSHGVQATASAQAIAANAANCVKPWVVADKWDEVPGPWTQSSAFNPPTDTYIAPYGTSGTGFARMDDEGNLIDYGKQLALKFGNPAPPNQSLVLSSGWATAVDLPNADNGNDYTNNITGCTSVTVTIALQNAQCLAPDPANGCIDVLSGGRNGAVNGNHGLPDLMALDSSAHWDTTLNRVVSTQSPSRRIVPIALFDPALYVASGANGTNGVVKVVNLMGFFVEGACKDAFTKEPYLDCSNNENDIVGRMVPFNGEFVPTGATNGPNSFGVVIRLVR